MNKKFVYQVGNNKKVKFMIESFQVPVTFFVLDTHYCNMVDRR